MPKPPYIETTQGRWITCVVIGLAAVVMGLPALAGGFVGGDDHRLVLNHVFVNHPSLSHAMKLFTIVHRDLYQPLPLLSFQFEFAIANALGLFNDGVAGGAWLFHLDNMLLHALNAMLVFALIRRLHPSWDRTSPAGVLNKDAPAQQPAPTGQTTVAAITAMLFAIHPFQTEVVAWTNGRMMLLSTLFALLTMLAFCNYTARPAIKCAVYVVVFSLLCAISKVRVSLPILLGVVVLARQVRIDRRIMTVWCAGTLVTFIFAVVNYQATAGAELFSEANQYLTGPRIVRVVLALGFYFQHFVWPLGLASYYPTPPQVHWLDGGNATALLITVAGIGVMAWASLRSRLAFLGFVWFFAALAVTLPFILARNILAADRYMYLPIIGLFWPVALACRAVVLHRQRLVRPLGIVGCIVAVVLVGICWRVGWSYTTPLRKTLRTARLFPDTPRVWERVGWTYHGLDDYVQAEACARKELRHEAPAVRSGAYQLLGMCALHTGRAEEALALLHRAVEADSNSAGLYRLGTAYDETDQVHQAMEYYEQSVAASPRHNPRRNRLAKTYRRLGRLTDARRVYEESLKTNPFEVPAIMGLVELDIAEGSPRSFTIARSRLVGLLSWMPENSQALTNLGVIDVSQGRPQNAIESYRRALTLDGSNVTALLNLGQLALASGEVDLARSCFIRADKTELAPLAESVAIHEFYLGAGELDRCVGLWKKFVGRDAASVEAKAYLAWAYALVGDDEQAAREVRALVDAGSELPLLSATSALIALSQMRYTDATGHVATLCSVEEENRDARRALLRALEIFDGRKPGVALTFCIATRLLRDDDNLQGAEVSLLLCEQRCADLVCRKEIAELRAE